MHTKLPLFLLAFAVAATMGLAQHKNSVTYARTWDAAIEEAKLLNTPIVVHSHGFYCGPCWGMHGSVLLNKKYAKFADAHTVEVISLSRLEEGREKGDRKAETYKSKDGNEYMVEFPNLTYDEMIALNRSKAATYNDTGKIPFTCIVDPHTLKEIHRWSGGISSKSIMETVMEFKKQLQADHGKGVSRDTIRKVDSATKEAAKLAESFEFAKALKVLDKVGSSSQDWPDVLKTRLAWSREAVITAAGARLDEVAKSDDAKRELRRLIRKLDGTGHESKAEEILKGL